MKLATALVVSCCVAAAASARAEDAEVLIGASPEACAAERARKPPRAQLGPSRQVGAVLGWLASSTCRQYLIASALLGRALPLEPTLTAAELERMLPVLLAGARLTSRAYAVTRITQSTLEGQLSGNATEAPPEPAPALGIRCRERGHCSLPRASLDRLLGNSAELTRQARIVPAVRDAAPLGFKLYAIRPGSIYAQLGLENGDTVIAINGQPLATPDQALQLYERLRGATHVTITLERRGVAEVVEIEIVGP